MKPWLVDGMKLFAAVCGILLSGYAIFAGAATIYSRHGVAGLVGSTALTALGASLSAAYLGRKKETNDGE